MLFFNWMNLVKEAGGDPFKTVNLLKDYYNNKILKYGLKGKLKGNSFIINAEKLFSDTSTDILYIYQYILLASRRDYTLYKLYGNRTLALSFYPDIDKSAIVSNPLLQIQNNEIHFKYEEL